MGSTQGKENFDHGIELTFFYKMKDDFPKIHFWCNLSRVNGVACMSSFYSVLYS